MSFKRRGAASAAWAIMVGLLLPGLALGARPEGDAAYYGRVDARIEALMAKGVSAQAIDAVLADEFGWVAAGRIEEPLDTEMAVAQAGTIPWAPTASDVKLNLPTVYWNAPQLRYEVRATWQWKICQWSSGDMPCWNTYSNPQVGQEGFGLHFDKQVYRKSNSLTVWTQSGYGRNYTVPEEFENYGVTYSEFDIWDWRGYSWDHGSLYMSFTLPSSSCVHGVPIEIDTKMGHTWQNTDLSSITVSRSGISLSFSQSINRWTGVSNPVYWYPCG